MVGRHHQGIVIPSAEHLVRFAGEALPRGVPGPLYVISVLTPSPWSAIHGRLQYENSKKLTVGPWGSDLDSVVKGRLKICLCSVVLDASFRKGMIFGRGVIKCGFSLFFLTNELLISGSKPYRFSVLTSITNEGRFPSTRCPGTWPI